MFHKLSTEDNVSFVTRISQLSPQTAFSRFANKYMYIHFAHIVL
jgi:hypothetical protein